MAGTIDQLNFEIILDDKKFKDLVETDLKLAQQLNTNLTAIFNLKARLDSVSTKEAVNAEKVAEATAKRATQEQKLQTEMAKTALQQQKVATETERTRQAQEKNLGAVKSTNTALTSTSNIMRTITQLTGVYFGAMGVRRLLSSLIEITGQFEVQRMALRSMLQDIDGADKIFEDLYRFSSESTYRFSELAKYAKQLAAFNIEQKNLLETTKMLGDVASGVGVSMDRIILAYGHVKSSGFLRGIQLRSFSQNGVPVLDELAKMFSELENRAVSLGEVFDKMTKREIPFEMVEQAFKNMTSEGGKFYQMQEVLAKTLAGQINILKGRWENMLAAWGQANSGVLKDTVSTVSNLIANFEEVGRVIKELVAAYGIYTASLISMEILTNTFVLANHKLLASLVSIGKWIINNPYAILAAAIAAVAYSAYKSATAINEIDQIQIAATKSVQKFNNEVETEIGELDSLYAKLKFAKEGTEEFNAAKLAIEKRFGPYIQQLRAEGREVSDLATLYDALATKIREATKERFREAATEDLTKAYGNATNTIKGYFDRVVGSIETGLGRSLSAKEREALWTKVRGGINADNDNLFVRTTLGLKSGLNTVNTDIQMIGKVYDLAGKTISHAGETNQNILDALGVAWKEASDKYATSMTETMEAFKAFDESQQTGPGEGGGNVYKVSDIIKGIQNLDKEIDKIRAKARKGSITEEEADRLEQLIGDRDTQKKLYEQIMGIKYDKDMRGLASGQSKAEQEMNEERARIKGNISVLEKYKAAYDKLEPVFGADAARAWVFNKMGYDVQNLDKDLGNLIDDLKKLGDEGKRDAEAAEARLGMDEASKAVKEYKAAAKAVEDYDKAFAKFDKDWGNGATGVTGKVEDALRKYNNENKKADDEYKDALDALTKKHKGNTEAMKEEKKVLDDLYAARKKANEANRNDAITNLADDIFKEAMSGHDLSNWDDKTLAQILEIKRALKDVIVPDKVKEMVLAEEDGEEILALIDKELGSIIDKLLNNTVSPEVAKKWAKYGKLVATYIGKAGDAMKRLGEASRNAKLSDAGKAITAISENLNAAMEGYQKSGHWIGAVVGGVVNLAEQGVNALVEMEQEEQRVIELMKDIAATAEETRFNRLLQAGVDSIFGSNSIREIKNALEGARQAQQLMADLEEERLNRMRQMFFDAYRETPYYKDWSDDRIWELVEERMADMYGIENARFGQGKNNVAETYGATLKEMAEKYGMDIFDGSGILNVELLEAIKKGEQNLTAWQIDWLDKQIAYVKEYEKAYTIVKETVQSITGDIASNAADSIVEGWIAAGNAALDYADILDDVARAYAKMLVQDVIFKNVFDDAREKELIDAFGDGSNTEKFMEMIAEDMQKIQDLAPVISQILEPLDPYFNHSATESSNSLGSGIKSITEDTANLLASYINAIRADVSVMRGLQESGWESISTAVPTMNDYLNRVAANTFDTAQNTQRILSELQSVIGAPGTSGMVVRVERM